MIMLSNPEFAAITYRTFEDTPPAPDWQGHAATWPANEFMLSSLLRSGRSGTDIATLSGVETGEVARLRTLYDV